MKFLASTFKVLGILWLALGALLIIIGIIGTWMHGGFSAIQRLMSPFNLANDLAIFVTLGPGIGALLLSRWLHEKQAAAAE